MLPPRRHPHPWQCLEVFLHRWPEQKASCRGWINGEKKKPQQSLVPSPRGHRCLLPLSPVRLPPALSFLPSEGGKAKEEQPYEKNVNLLITEYIAVHLKCCCYANTLGVYFLNPGVKRLVPRSPAELFEYGAAAAVSV